MKPLSKSMTSDLNDNADFPVPNSKGSSAVIWIEEIFTTALTVAHILVTDGCLYGYEGMFRVAPPYELKTLEAIFQHKV